jgi:hypothetical protein
MQANMPVEAETSQMQQDHENVLQMRRDKLASLLDDESRSKVLRKIFDNDTHRYEELVREVLLCPSWKEAAGVIDRFYAKNGTHPDSAVAMEFAQALHRSIA